MTPQQEQALADFQKMIDKLCVKKINLMQEVNDINQTIIFLGQQRDNMLKEEWTQQQQLIQFKLQHLEDIYPF